MADELNAGPATTDGGTCFLITPIGEMDTPQRSRADRLLKDILEPVMQRHGIEVERADRMDHPGIITTHIVNAIIDARVIVVDLIERNPNVYYELGIAEAFVKPVIHIGGNAADLPFDKKPARIISLPSRDGGTIDVRDAELCRDALAGQLRKALSPDFEPESMVTQAGRRARIREDLAAPGTDPLLGRIAREVETMRDEMAFTRRQLGDTASAMSRYAEMTVARAEAESSRHDLEDRERFQEERARAVELMRHRIQDVIDPYSVHELPQLAPAMYERLAHFVKDLPGMEKGAALQTLGEYGIRIGQGPETNALWVEVTGDGGAVRRLEFPP